jgi:hypothetical protein
MVFKMRSRDQPVRTKTSSGWRIVDLDGEIVAGTFANKQIAELLAMLWGNGHMVVPVSDDDKAS